MKPVTVEIEGQTYLKMEEGKPVYKMDDGTEQGVDPASMHTKIMELNREGATRRTKISELESQMKAFEGIEDPAAALKALETVAGLDGKDLKNAEEVERIKAAAIEAVKKQYEPFEQENAKLKQSLRKEVVSGRFSRSKYLTEKTTMTPAVAEAVFGGNFEVVEGKLKAKDSNGNEIFSMKNAGEVADFDEALSILVSNHPDRESLLRGANKGGGGAGGGGGGDTSGDTISRQDFEKLDQTQRREVLKTKKLVDA